MASKTAHRGGWTVNELSHCLTWIEKIDAASVRGRSKPRSRIPPGMTLPSLPMRQCHLVLSLALSETREASAYLPTDETREGSVLTLSCKYLLPQDWLG